MSVKDIKKNDEFLIYRMNDRTQNNQPTYDFKTSSEIAENITRGKNHYLSNAFAFFDGNEKRTKRMITNVSYTIEKTNHSCHDGL